MWKLLLSIFVLFIESSLTRKYERCELARELVDEHDFSMDDISDWICLVQHESNFDTSAVRALNNDGSKDHGIFQISDLWWCSEPGEISKRNACNNQCRAFRDSSLADDVSCIKKIFAETQQISGNGFSAWVAWNVNCKGRDLDRYVDGCFTGPSNGKRPILDDFPNSIEFFPMSPENPPKSPTIPRKPEQSPPSTQNPMFKPRYPPITTRYPRYPTAKPRYPTTRPRYPTANYPPAKANPGGPIQVFQCQGSFMQCQYTPGPGQYNYSCKWSKSEGGSGGRLTVEDMGA